MSHPHDQNAPSKTDQARAKAGVVAEEANAKTDATANAAKAKTLGTAEAAEQKLESFKADVKPAAQPSDSKAAPKQGAFNQAIGLPRDAPTASDAPGTGTAANAPTDAAAGSAAGAMTGPVAPTGQGGVLAETGATASGPGGFKASVKQAAYTAADKAQQSLESAKAQFGKSEPPVK